MSTDKTPNDLNSGTVRGFIAQCPESEANGVDRRVSPGVTTENKMPTYSNSRDEEIYHGDYAGPEDAAAAAFYDDPDLETVWVGENKKQTAHAFVDGESILESATERAYDEAGECSEDWLAGLLRDKAKCAELGKVVGDWIEANEPPQFWTVLNARKIMRAEMVAAGHLEGAT